MAGHELSQQAETPQIWGVPSQKIGVSPLWGRGGWQQAGQCLCPVLENRKGKGMRDLGFPRLGSEFWGGCHGGSCQPDWGKNSSPPPKKDKENTKTFPKFPNGRLRGCQTHVGGGGERFTPKIHVVGRERVEGWGGCNVLDGRDNPATIQGQSGPGMRQLWVGSSRARGLQEGILELCHVHNG